MHVGHAENGPRRRRRGARPPSFAAEEARELEVLIGERSLLDGLTKDAKGNALRMAAGPAVFMFLSYLVLILWFKSKGGYRPVSLS